MSDQEQGTSENTQDQTDNGSDVGTDGANGSEASPDKLVQELQSKVASLEKSNKDLLSQRDKNHEDKKKTEEDVQQFIADTKRKEAVTEFLSDNEKEYPNVKPADLAGATSPDEIKAIADRVQTRAEEMEQDILDKLQVVGKPDQLSDQDYEKSQDELKKSKDPHAFEKAMDQRASRSGFDLSVGQDNN